MSDFIRVPRAFKKRSKRSLLTVTTTAAAAGAEETATSAGSSAAAEMGRKSFKEKKSFKRGSVKERWLLTRKTWRFMTDAGRRLLPEGVGNKVEDIPKIEQYFQDVCRNEPRFLVWRRKCSYPGASGPLPKRRWKRRMGTMSPKKACSADEAEDDAADASYDSQIQLMIDMLKNYLDIREDEEGEEEEAAGSEMPPRDLSAGSSALLPKESSSAQTVDRNVTERLGENTTNLPSSQCYSSSGAGASKRASENSHINTTNTPFPLFSLPRDRSSEFSPFSGSFANTKRFGRAHSLMEQITPAMLNDKVALRRLYDQLKATPRMDHRSRFRIPSPKAQFERSALGLHKTFAFPELSGKSKGLLSFPKKSGAEGSTWSLLLRDYDAAFGGGNLVFKADERTVADSGRPLTPERRITFNTQGIQTDSIPLPVLNELSAEFKRQMDAEEALQREEEMAQLGVEAAAARNNDRRNSEDVSQSVSDTIKRYLRMARKKPPKDDVNRFKRINYDRNLRNIKAKGEITKIGDDDGDCKGCQTDYDWIEKSFADLSKDAPKTVPAIRPTTLPRPGKSSLKHESTTTPISSPSSPGISSSIFHTSTQFLSNLFGHTQITGSGSITDAPSNDSIYGSSQSAMQKSKSSSNIVSRKIWKSRSKSQCRPVELTKSQWTPQGNCVWTSPQGNSVHLKESVLLDLTEVERKVLFQLALGKINQLQLGVNSDSLLDSITNKAPTQKPAKRKALLLKRKALTTGFFDIGKDGSKVDNTVFGISLEESMEKELKALQGSRAAPKKPDRRARNSLSSLMDPNPAAYRNSGSCESLPSKTHPNLADNELLKGSLSQFDVRRNSHDEEEDGQLEGMNRTDRPQVPALIVTCIQHLEKHGLHSVGIFRKSTSKKRVRQLRENFDQGVLQTLDDDTCPHDVATLLKEYLRDLPEPLLCRRLYQPFVNTQKIRNRRIQFETICHLVQVLPVPHRDTLHYLLAFLAKVAQCADDIKSPGGEILSEGNKMDSNNLATVFAPNLLHNAVPGQVTTEQEVDERLDVINVIRIMIDHYKEMFRVSAETMDEIYLNMIDSHPQQLDALCDRHENHRRSGRVTTDSDGTISPLSPLSPGLPKTTTAQLLEANKQKRLYAREEFLHQNVTPKTQGILVNRNQRESAHETGSSRNASIENVLTASLKIPVQTARDVMSQKIELQGKIQLGNDDLMLATSEDCSSGSGSRHVMHHIDSRKSSSSGTITGTLSLVQSPVTSTSTSPDYRSTDRQQFFGPDFREQVLIERPVKSTSTADVQGPGPDLRKSLSLFTVGSASAAPKRYIETKAPVKQKLSIHPSSISTIAPAAAVEPSKMKIPANITNIGNDIFRSKTEDFERRGQKVTRDAKRTYKRQEIISSAHNSKK